jgi:hypothetical protein
MAEMKRKGVATREVAASIGMRYNTFLSKLRGESEFTYSQARSIIDAYFVNFEKPEYLFEKSGVIAVKKSRSVKKARF